MYQHSNCLKLYWVMLLKVVHCSNLEHIYFFILVDKYLAWQKNNFSYLNEVYVVANGSVTSELFYISV